MGKVKTTRSTFVTDRVYVKWVKKANMWVETRFDDKGKQILRWFNKDANGNEIVL